MHPYWHAGAAEELRRLADGYLSVATSELPSHAHLSAEERATLQKEASDALSWLQDKLAQQVCFANKRVACEVLCLEGGVLC